MGQKKYKLINLRYYDKSNFEHLLNKASSEGWNLIRINRVFCTFEKQEDRKYYTVLPNYSSYSFNKYNELFEQQIEFKNYISDFGYKSYLKNREFEIYESSQERPIFTDDSIDDDANWYKNKIVKKKILSEHLFGSVVYIFLLILNYHPSNIYFTLQSNLSIITLFLWMYIILQSLYELYRAIKYTKTGKATLVKKWRTVNNTPMQLVLLGIFGVIPIVLLLSILFRSSTVTFIFLLHPVVFISIIMMIYFYVRKKYWSNFKKVGVILVSTVLAFFATNYIFSSIYFYSNSTSTKPIIQSVSSELFEIDYINKLASDTESRVYKYSSLVLEELDISNAEGSLTIVKSKINGMDDFVFKAFIKDKYRSDIKEVKDDYITRIDNMNIFRYKNILVETAQDITPEMIIMTKLFVEGNKK